jgi:hypothetical protein
MPKAWNYEPAISDYELLLLQNALHKHHDEYQYHPIAIARREETGVRYRFFCIAVSISDTSLPSHFADIEIYKPPTGMPYISSLYRIQFDSLRDL